MVQGEFDDPRCVFFDKATLDVEASKEAGKRVYISTVMIKLTQAGVTDWVAYRAQAEDFLKYPEEYQYFLNNRQGERSPRIDIIPGMEMAHQQELIDYGLGTIDKLCAAELVPPHLEYAQASARRLQIALRQEIDHGHEKGQTESGQKAREESIAEDGPAPDRRDHPDRVQGRAVPDRAGREKGHPAKGSPPGGRLNGGGGLDANWDIQLG